MKNYDLVGFFQSQQQAEQTRDDLLAAGFDRFFEIGPGRVLAGLLKRVQRKVDCQNITA